MKKENFYNIVLFIICILALYFIVSELTDEPITNTIIKVDKDTVYKVDTVKIPKIVYITKLEAKIDTIYIDSSQTVVASADTVLEKDSSEIKVSYYFPPKNFFDISLNLKEKIIYDTKTITELQTINKKFYEDTWFYTTIISILTLILLEK